MTNLPLLWGPMFACPLLIHLMMDRVIRATLTSLCCDTFFKQPLLTINVNCATVSLLLVWTRKDSLHCPWTSVNLGHPTCPHQIMVCPSLDHYHLCITSADQEHPTNLAIHEMLWPRHLAIGIWPLLNLHRSICTFLSYPTCWKWEPTVHLPFNTVYPKLWTSVHPA